MRSKQNKALKNFLSVSHVAQPEDETTVLRTSRSLNLNIESTIPYKIENLKTTREIKIKQVKLDKIILQYDASNRRKIPIRRCSTSSQTEKENTVSFFDKPTTDSKILALKKSTTEQISDAASLALLKSCHQL